MPAPLVIGSLIVTGYGMVKQSQAANASATLAQSVGQRNANIDLTAAKQLELDTNANILAQRRNDAVYSSQQATAYASAGVLNDSGSPLAARATTVGRMQQNIQQTYTDATQREAQMQDSARAGILYSDANASAIRTQNEAAMLKGGVNLLSTINQDYRSGAFSSGYKW